jgi:hypothetical protein
LVWQVQVESLERDKKHKPELKEAREALNAATKRHTNAVEVVNSYCNRLNWVQMLAATDNATSAEAALQHLINTFDDPEYYPTDS